MFKFLHVTVGVCVDVLQQQGVCYAFVEFEDTTSALNAIEVRALPEDVC